MSNLPRSPGSRRITPVKAKVRKGEPPRITTCASTHELAFGVQHNLQPDDHVAEIGAQLRTVASTVCQRFKKQWFCCVGGCGKVDAT